MVWGSHRDIDTLRQMISQSIPQLFNSGIMVVSIIVCMLMLNVPLTVVSLVMVGVMVYVSKRLATLSGKYFIQQQKDLGAANGYIEEMGTHEELMEKKGYYYELVKLQTGVDEL